MATAGAIKPFSLVCVLAAVVFLCPPSLVSAAVLSSDPDGLHLDRPRPVISAPEIVEIAPEEGSESDTNVTRVESKLRDGDLPSAPSDPDLELAAPATPDEALLNDPVGSRLENASQATPSVAHSNGKTSGQDELVSVKNPAVSAQNSKADSPAPSASSSDEAEAHPSQDVGPDDSAIKAQRGVNMAAATSGESPALSPGGSQPPPPLEPDASSPVVSSAASLGSGHSAPSGSSNLPATDDSNLPAVDNSDLRVTDDRNSPALDNSDLPATDDRNSPALDNSDLPATDDRNSPALDNSDLPATDDRNSPALDNSDLPATGDRNSPALDNSNSPATDNSDNAEDKSTGTHTGQQETLAEVSDKEQGREAERTFEDLDASSGAGTAAAAAGTSAREGRGRTGRRSRLEDYLTVVPEDELQRSGADQKGGRCPSRVLAPELCPEGVADQCHHDSDCSGSSKCCSTGCARVCVRPLSSACELQRENTIRRGRALGLSESELSEIPRCDDTSGSFVEVQCNTEYCYCANPDTGYEVPGTRARAMQEVNCSNPRPCAGYQCRMLCPYQFALDDEGCPLCRCRDPCEGILCPEGTSCLLQEASCTAPPCPPLPSCQKPVTLASLCPLGAPLTVGDAGDRPFLCGDGPNGPACPTLYTCHVSQGHDYGVCCADVDKLIKPGSCPLDAATAQPTASPDLSPLKDEVEVEEELRCGVSCSHDLQCPSTQKCCVSDICGQHCIQPANLTVCMHQRMVAELLVVSEREGRGYVPQCRPQDGLYAPRQCSRNGRVCWCVDPEGAKVPGSIGPAEQVTCDHLPLGSQHNTEPSTAQPAGRSDALPSLDSSTAPTARGGSQERNGHATEDTTAEEAEDPTEDTAENVTENTVAYAAGDATEDARGESGGDPVCPLGLSPLWVGSMILQCDEHNPCPKEHFCTMPGGGVGQAKPFCCPMPREIESTKGGSCPPVGALEDTPCLLTSVCASDDHCGGEAKCCVVPACGGPVCVGDQGYGGDQGYPEDQALLQGPTMCEYLRDLALQEGVDLAVATPSCGPDGSYDLVQCNELGQCWCVDVYGTPLPGTRVSSRSLVTCEKLRESLSCGEVLCRLGCDYGFVLDPDTGCPLCMCRDPCQDVECEPGSTCELVDIPCVDGICPPVPQCVPQPRQGPAPTCPKGQPYTVPGSNDSLSCSPRARALECPRGFACVALENDVEGVCCSAHDSRVGKVGQCPFLVPTASQSCDLECASDAHCGGDMKCCSNGCGLSCVAPVLKTACQHQRTLLEHRAREAGVPARHVYLPECTSEGTFARVQCHPGTTTCWCVDHTGLEVPGTRVSQPAYPNCKDPATCPDITCDLACLHGLALDERGCPTCACRDPCEKVTCDSPLEECRMVHVACVGEPCPPLPVCLPKIDNPCPTGSPLSVNGTLVQCGPEGTVCPSSHKCHLSPLGEYAVCCRKPREVCYEPRDSGFCEGSIRRWHFDPEKNECRSFRFGGCGGNLNNFESEVECRNACPVLSPCEKLRAKNIQKAEKNKRMTFIPKCEKGTGAWLPQQCLEELGVCWCVTPEGDQVAGSLTRGSPDCSPRQARRLDVTHADRLGSVDTICDAKQTVHVCDKSLCEDKVCLSHPTAVCRVNPCDGCSVQFVDSLNRVVACSERLTACQTELQDALNSPAAIATFDGSSSEMLYENNVVFDYLHNADVYSAPLSPVEVSSASPVAFDYSRQRPLTHDFDGTASLPEYVRSSGRSFPETTQEQAHFARHFEFIPPEAGTHDEAQYSYGVQTEGISENGGGVAPDGGVIVLDGGVIGSNSGGVVVIDGDRMATDPTRFPDSGKLPEQGRLLRSRRTPTEPSLNDDAFVMPMVSSSAEPRLDDADEENFASSDYDLNGGGNSIPKPGTCPTPAADVSLLTCEPRQECLQDSHCRGSAKCCFTGCGSACLQPLEVPFSSAGMQAAIPMCERDGSYSRTQTSHGWSWCVDSSGAPLHHTLTRGHVRCGPRGQILERTVQSPVCPGRPGTTPRVCATECRSAVCPAHPDAVCVADPCNDCRIAFFSSSGEQVHCEDQCSQPLTKGMCRASIRRFFHNSSSGRCEEFDYGGCQGNDNNFATLEECQDRCERPASACDLPVRPGTCVAGETRWYYSATAQTCLPFLYTGCGGNANNFPTKLHCQSSCPEMVLCPFWSPTTMEPTPCSRTRACHNATCHGYPQAVCVVEPCTCEPYFTDQHGQTVECLRPTVPPKTILAFSYEQDLPDKVSAEELSGSQDPVVLYLEGEPSVGRCELLHRHLLSHQQQAPQRRYLPQCDAKGGFLPTQCYTGVYVHDWAQRGVASTGKGLPKCWCVDETGKKTHPSAYFLKGQRQCEPVMVESVVVTLGFHGHKAGLDHLGRKHQKQIRKQMSDLLASLSPAVVDGQMAVVDLPDVTQVKFTLKGSGKIDAAYKLEDKVRRGDLALHLSQGRRVPADMKASWFHHEVVPSLWRDDSEARADLGRSRAGPREVVISQVERSEPAFLTASVVVTVVSVAALCALVVAVVLYKRHVAGTYAKSSHGSTQSLAFSDSSLDRRSISSGKFCAQLEHPKLDARVPSVTTIENEFRAVTRH